MSPYWPLIGHDARPTESEQLQTIRRLGARGILTITRDLTMPDGWVVSLSVRFPSAVWAEYRSVHADSLDVALARLLLITRPPDRPLRSITGRDGQPDPTAVWIWGQQ